MADSIAARSPLSSFGPRSCALERVSPISLDLSIRGHGERISKLRSFCNFDPG